MIPQKGQYVKCLLRSSLTIEGIIEHWSAEEVQLKSFDGERLILVHGGIVDILLTTVLLNPIKKVPTKELPEIKQEIAKKLRKIIEPEEKDPEMQKLDIKQLQALVQEQEKQIITQKQREHFGSVGISKQAQSYTLPLDLLKGK